MNPIFAVVGTFGIFHHAVAVQNRHFSSADAVVDRLKTDADLDAVAELEARCFTNPWTREMLARELAQSDVAQVFILRLPGQIVGGFCSCWIIVDELHLNTVAVDYPYRRLGLATHLVTTVMTEAARHGVTRATLEVRASNVAARRLYEGLGFAVRATRAAYYILPEDDALIMWRDDLADLVHPNP
jgi:[ribosomal protein S18]-alanine N-acetyltransferase